MLKALGPPPAPVVAEAIGHYRTNLFAVLTAAGQVGQSSSSQPHMRDTIVVHAMVEYTSMLDAEPGGRSRVPQFDRS